MLVGAAIRPFVGHGSVGFACPLFTSTGIPCPLCGMTTSVTATAQLEIGDALAANPAGVVAVVVAVVLLVAWRVRTVALPVWLVPAALAAMWVFELVRFGIMRMPGAT